ncbi:MAG TPA: hypothetical protein DIS79_09725 [Bacteroidetes bacterium]|nr:hypothetical protein [Bacteroidota bacterium]
MAVSAVSSWSCDEFPDLTTVISIDIIGLQDGSHPIALDISAADIPGLSPEYVGSVVIDGTLHKIGKRFQLDTEVEATARLVCDRSLEEYDEQIVTELGLDFVVDSALALKQEGHLDELDDDDVRGLRDDARTLDITDDVRQLLILGLPMKRVAPQYRTAELTDIHPILGSDSSESSSDTIDDRWAALKDIKRP